MEMKFTASSSIYNDTIFLNGTKTILCVVQMFYFSRSDCVVSVPLKSQFHLWAQKLRLCRNKKEPKKKTVFVVLFWVSLHFCRMSLNLEAMLTNCVLN